MKNPVDHEEHEAHEEASDLAGYRRPAWKKRFR
jgi:hypothetical protein